MHFTISRPQQKKRNAQHGGEAASTAACAIDFKVSLDALNANNYLHLAWVKI
jgi:hypothetical protein